MVTHPNSALCLPIDDPFSRGASIGTDELRLSSVAAHELRAPLQALTTSIELLVEDVSAAGTQQAQLLASSIMRQSLWLRSVVENILCAAAIEDGHFQVHPEPADLNDIAIQVQPIIHPLVAKKRQRLLYRLGNSLPDVLVDNQKIGQVLVNLLVNASKYSPSDTPIEVRLTSFRGQDGEWVRVMVADRGPGLPDGGADALFKPFFRGGKPAGASGAGLGLAIVRSIVEAHGGSVGAGNRRQGGACFWFDLPAKVDEEAGKVGFTHASSSATQAA
jgi:two-component system, OmpR family, sensor histidine kinase KdpD